MILVTGATGNVGRELVTQLLARGQEVRALTRDPTTADLPGEVRAVRGDLSDEEVVVGALEGVEAVFLNVVGDVEPTARALARSAVRRVVLLSTQSAGSRPDLAEAERYRRLEARVRDVRADAVVLRPGQFMSNALWWSPMIEQGHVAAPFADVPVPMIDPGDVAAAALEALLEDGHAGATHLLAGADAPTPRERAAVVAEVLERRITFSELTEQEFRDGAASLPAPAVDYMVAMMGHPTEEDLRTGDAGRALTGRTPSTFRDWVGRHRDALLGQ